METEKTIQSKKFNGDSTMDPRLQIFIDKLLQDNPGAFKLKNQDLIPSEALKLLEDIGKKIQENTREKQATSYLIQGLPMSV